MNASATIRASYIRQARMSFAPPPPRASNVPSAIGDLEPRPAFDEKLKDFVHVNHIEHREKCHAERTWDVEKHAHTDIDPQSTFEWSEDVSSVRVRLKKMLTTFPYRDPIYLVAIVFLLGSIDLVVNAFLDLVPRVRPETALETAESVAVPTTALIGSILFFAAGIFDTFAQRCSGVRSSSGFQRGRSCWTSV
jgi:hypothetical protein